LEEDRDQAPELILVEQGAVGADKSRTCRPMFAASSGLMIVASSAGSCVFSGCRWCDCPPECGPPTTIYNRFVR
jgi:hypothetical protein